MPKSSGSSSCTVTYVGGTASVSCVDSISSEHQVILVQDNDPYNLTVVNVRPGEEQTVLVFPSGRYFIMAVPMGVEFDPGVKHCSEFIAEDLNDSTVPAVIDRNVIISKT